MIGSPIGHVRTPELLCARLERMGVQAEVVAKDIKPDALNQYMRGQMSSQVTDGFLVTMPHKQAVASYLAATSKEARLAGSVNTIKRAPDGSLIGAQFDGHGLLNALLDKNVILEGAHVLLAGIGGAGLAIAHALAGHSCKSLTLVDTDIERLRVAGETLAKNQNCCVEAATADETEPFDLLINATPIGMGRDDCSPFRKDWVSRAKYVADIVADPAPTRLADIVAASGGTLISGRDMVCGQIGLIADWLTGSNVDQPQRGQSIDIVTRVSLRKPFNMH